jgi:hypothetical protein
MQYITYSMSFQLCRLIVKRSSGYLTRYPAPVCKLTDSIHRISFPPTVPCTLAPRIKKHRLNKSLDLQNRAPFAFALCDRIEFHAVGTAPGCRFVRKIVRRVAFATVESGMSGRNRWLIPLSPLPRRYSRRNYIGFGIVLFHVIFFSHGGSILSIKCKK